MPLLWAADFSWSDTTALTARSAKYFTPKTGDWTRMAALALAICFFANTLVYVYAKVFHSPGAERFAKSEFYQVTASALLIFLLVGGGMMVMGFDFLDKSGILPQGTLTKCGTEAKDVWKEGPPAVIRCQLQEKITYVEALYQQAWDLNAQTEPLTTYCMYLFNIPIYCWDWDVDLHSQMEKAHYIAHKLMPIGVSLHAQYMFVEYLANNMLNVFLPLGLILRIFPVLRGLGSLMVAMAIAFFFVFPIAYILLDPTTVRPPPKQLIPGSGTAEKACYVSFSGMVNTYTQVIPKAAASAQNTKLDINSVGSEVAKLQIEAFFYPLAALATALMFIGIITPILGGDSGEIMHFLTKVI